MQVKTQRQTTIVLSKQQLVDAIAKKADLRIPPNAHVWVEGSQSIGQLSMNNTHQLTITWSEDA
jgi:hypothetical protein